MNVMSIYEFCTIGWFRSRLTTVNSKSIPGILPLQDVNLFHLYKFKQIVLQIDKGASTGLVFHVLRQQEIFEINFCWKIIVVEKYVPLP